MTSQDRRRINFYHGRKQKRDHDRRVYELTAYTKAIRGTWSLVQVRACIAGELPIPEGCTMAQAVAREKELTTLLNVEIAARKNGAGAGCTISLAQIHAAELQENARP